MSFNFSKKKNHNLFLEIINYSVENFILISIPSPWQIRDR